LSFASLLFLPISMAASSENIAMFTSVTGASADVAEGHLLAAKGDLEQAIANFLDGACSSSDPDPDRALRLAAAQQREEASERNRTTMDDWRKQQAAASTQKDTQPAAESQAPELPQAAVTDITREAEALASEAPVAAADVAAGSEPTSQTLTPSMALALKLQREEELGLPSEDPRFGKALPAKLLKEMSIYFERQEPESDTCAQKALNNLAQRMLFSIEDLGLAEVAHGEGGWGMDLNESTPSVGSQMPTGFFDVEAVKRAAAQKGMQVVEAEPKADYRESELPSYLEGCGSLDEDGKVIGRRWFKGFLVYDSRPGHARHFYAIVGRPGRQFAVLNSLEEEFGAQNRLLTEQELWAMYEHYSADFRSWVFRWYPVVSQREVVSSLQDTLQADDPHWTIRDDRADRVIQACRWQVTAAAHRLLQEDVQRVLYRLRAGRLVITRNLAQAELEAANGDAQKAAEKLAQVLQDQAAVSMPEDTAARQALNAASWSVDGAVSVLELVACGPPASYEAMRDILQRVEWHFDHAVKVRKVVTRCSSQSGDATTDREAEVGPELDVETATTLLEACAWKVDEVVAVFAVQKGYPACPVPIVRTVLNRNDGDSRAAMEMLKDFRERVSGHVAKCARSSNLLRDAAFSEEDIATLATAALDMGDWNPAPVLDKARRLVDFTLATKVLCARAGQPNVASAQIMWALQECGETATPEVAARVLLFGEDPETAMHHAMRPKGQGKGKGIKDDNGYSDQQQAQMMGKHPEYGQGHAQMAKAKAKPKAKNAARRPAQHDDSSDCSVM
jgi:hypothetical protein